MFSFFCLKIKKKITNTIGDINPNVFNPHALHDTEARHILFWARIKAGLYVEEDKV